MTAIDPRPLQDVRESLLQRSGLLAPESHPELERWTSVLRRGTGSAVAALAVAHDGRILVSCLWVGEAGEPRTAELSASESLEQFLSSQVPAPVWADGHQSYLEAPVTIDGHEICTIAVADAAPRDWDEEDRLILDHTVTAIASEIRLRLANDEAQRFHDLVISQHRVHELIAGGAPLGEVLVELVQGIESHDPSVLGCVVLLDRESNTLHPGAGPSLPPHYLAAIDGVVIGPNVGACGSASWSGQLTISDDISTDPRWAPIRDFVLKAGLGHCWSMPIKAPAGEVLGTLALYGPKARRPLPAHIALMEDGARLAGIAIERHRALERLIHDARRTVAVRVPVESLTGNAQPGLAGGAEGGAGVAQRDVPKRL